MVEFVQMVWTVEALVAMGVQNDIAEFGLVEPPAENILDSWAAETIMKDDGAIFRWTVLADGLIRAAVEILKYFIWHVPAWFVERFNTPKRLAFSIPFGEAFQSKNGEIQVFGLLVPIHNPRQAAVVESVLATGRTVEVD